MALRIGYGLVTGQRPAASNQSWTEVYRDVVELAVVAEQAGFDTAWVSEHHFTDDGYLSALFPMLGALAARTERIRLGTNVALAPLYHPLRLAEDAAAVDVLSGGRLVLGLAIGYRDEEFQAFGIPKRERVARLEECVEVCRKAWRGEPFSHRGPLVEVNGLLTRPAPPGPPEIWLGGWVDAAMRRAARLADGYISPMGDLDDTVARLAVVDHEARAAGRAEPPLPVATATFVAVSADGEPPPGVLRGLGHMLETYGEWYGSSSDEGGGHQVGEMVQSLAAATPEGASPPNLVVGDPDSVAEQLLPLATAFSGEREHDLVVRLHYPGMGPDEAAAHIRLFADEVMPRLREAVDDAG